jgi:CYTH domain-containing protein
VTSEVSATLEVEYKYLVNENKLVEYLKDNASLILRHEIIKQHYIAKSDGNTVRLRRSVLDGKASYVLCVKGKGNEINEVETSVPEVFALPLMSEEFSASDVDKERITIRPDGDNFFSLKVEVDIYRGKLDGLIVAEVEVPHVDFKVPDSFLPSFIVGQASLDKSLSLSNYALSRLSEEESRQVVRKINKLVNF